MNNNFKLFEKYPHYIFNFTGANRYMMMGDLHYTTNGAEPTFTSPTYSGPFDATRGITVRARQFDAAGNGGPEAYAKFDISNASTQP